MRRALIWLGVLMPVFMLAAMGMLVCMAGIWRLPISGFGFPIGAAFGVAAMMLSFHIANLEEDR